MLLAHAKPDGDVEANKLDQGLEFMGEILNRNTAEAVLRGNPVNKLETAKTIIETADSLLNLINKAKEVILGDLEKKIKDIKLNVDGITKEQRENIELALAELYKSENDIQETRAILETLAEETIRRVDSMISYLGKVKDDWEAEKISKFLKFEAKKMTQLVDRSLDLLK